MSMIFEKLQDLTILKLPFKLNFFDNYLYEIKTQMFG